jgi:hypothetical protein
MLTRDTSPPDAAPGAEEEFEAWDEDWLWEL